MGLFSRHTAAQRLRSLEKFLCSFLALLQGSSIDEIIHILQEGDIQVSLEVLKQVYTKSFSKE